MKQKLPFLLLLAATIAAPAAAQEVRGQVQGRGGQPLAGARVRLVDSRGQPSGTDSTDRAGGFTLKATRGGRYSLHIDRVDILPVATPVFMLAADSVFTVTLIVDAAAVHTVHAVEVAAQRQEREAGMKSARSRPSNVLSESEINLNVQQTALEVVQVNRAHWLRFRGGEEMLGAPIAIQVYLDHLKMGPAPDALERIPAPWVARMQYLDGVEAAAAYGHGHDNGAIVVSSKKR